MDGKSWATDTYFYQSFVPYDGVMHCLSLLSEEWEGKSALAEDPSRLFKIRGIFFFRSCGNSEYGRAGGGGIDRKNRNSSEEKINRPARGTSVKFRFRVRETNTSLISRGASLYSSIWIME